MRAIKTHPENAIHYCHNLALDISDQVAAIKHLIRNHNVEAMDIEFKKILSGVSSILGVIEERASLLADGLDAAETQSFKN